MITHTAITMVSTRCLTTCSCQERTAINQPSRRGAMFDTLTMGFATCCAKYLNQLKREIAAKFIAANLAAI